MNKKIIGLGAVAMIIIGILGWAFIESTKPLPGEVSIKEGRDHKPENEVIEYKKDPPTSGDHYAGWTTKGFYEEPREDGYLIHSLEHGYIVIWYNCEKPVTGWIKEALADDATSSSSVDKLGRTPMSSGGEGSPSTKLSDMPKQFSDGSCNDLKNNLKQVYQDKGASKIVIVPRIGMPNPVVLTAWGRIEKLEKVDKDKISKFVDTYKNKGPEFTVEP